MKNSDGENGRSVLQYKQCTEDQRFTSKGSFEIVLVGTAHVSKKSVEEVIRKIEEIRPDIVAVELCEGRFKSLTGQDESQEIKISELIRGEKLYLVLVQLFLAYMQKKIGDETGVRPGSEMLAAIETAQKNGLKVALVDRDVSITIQRFWSSMGLVEKIKLISAIIPASMGWDGDEIDIETISQDDIVSQIISEFRRVSPVAANVLVDERDAYIAQNVYKLSKEGKVLAVVGAGHKEGIAKLLKHPETIPAIEDLKNRPIKRISYTKAFGIAMGGVMLATIGLILAKGYSTHGLILAFGIWFFVHGMLSSMGVIVARGYPLSALTAFLCGWMTNLIPFAGAGWFAGMVEASKRTPTVYDLKRLNDVKNFGDLMQNSFFRVIFVAAMANVGAVMATFLAIYIIWQMLGLVNPTDFLRTIL